MKKALQEDKTKYTWNQRKILRLCWYYRNQLAVGTPQKLRIILEIFLRKKYDQVISKDKKFSKKLHYIFGYKQFTEDTFADNVVEYAMDFASDFYATNFSRYNDNSVLQEITNELSIYDAGMAKQFETEINSLNIPSLTKEKIIEIINSIQNTYLVLTDRNFRFWANWNPYTMQFGRNIRTCPYCNRQYITAIQNGDRKVRADIDHFLPKGRYPIFSMSIYNLIPSCKVCNTLKWHNEFKLDEETPYEFSLDDIARFKYNIGRKKGIEFKEKSIKDHNLVESYENMFMIIDTYQFHENIANYLYENHQRYNEKWISDAISSGIISRTNLYKLIVGDVCKKEEILNEPLSKFKRDIIEQIWGKDVLNLVTDNNIGFKI